MAQTTANLVGSVLSSRANIDTPEAIITHEEDSVTGHRGHTPEFDDQAATLTNMTSPGGGVGMNAANHQSNYSKKGWKNKAKRIHRIVEQMDDEPVCIVIFKWCLILVGSVMLGVVLFLTGEVIYSWSTGDTNRQRTVISVTESANRTNLTSITTEQH